MDIRPVKLRDKGIKKIYLSSFPKSERMPYVLMLAMAKLWNTEFLGCFDGDSPVGLIYLAKNFRLVFIMFLAVDETLRSKGYGGAILREISARYPKKTILVSIEPPNGTPDRTRRKDFYLRNGFLPTGWFMKLGTEQEILIRNGSFSRWKFRSFLAHYSNGTLWPSMRKH